MWLHVGAILCGGKGSRMGRPKAGIRLADGQALIEHVYGALRPVCREVVLVGTDPSIPEALAGLTRVRDRKQDCGPLGGLEALLASGLDDEYLICPCDLPRATSALFELLVAPGVEAPAVLVAEFPEPLIARYAASSLPLVESALEERRLAAYELALRVHAAYVRVPAELRSALANANWPGEAGPGT